MNNLPLTVSQLIEQIKNNLEENFSSLWVEGEMTNFSGSMTGHYYFGLSDEESLVSCALFKGAALRNPNIKKLQNGDRIQVFGSINVYAKRGTFQIVVSKILLLDKEGLLKKQLENLKNKLQQEGLFELEYKKKIPRFPGKIALITAKGSAAESDFLNIMKRRSLWFHISIFPSLVQGAGAASSIIKSLDAANSDSEIDVIVIARGGGSLEDLWCFNDEKLARAIFESSKPVISAVGHEVDYTICDYVSDMRCETPSAAAEILSEPQTQLARRLNSCVDKIQIASMSLRRNVSSKMERLNPTNILQIIQERIFLAKNSLRELSLMERKDRLLRLTDHRLLIDDKINRLFAVMTREQQEHRYKLQSLMNLLKAYDNQSTLKRGYALICTDKQKIVSSYKQFQKECKQQFKITFYDGDINVKDSVQV